MTWWHVAGANRASLVEPLLRFIESVASDLCQNVVAAARDPDCSGAGPFQTLAGPSAHTGYLSVGRIEVGHHDPGCSSTDRCIEPPGPLGDLVWTLTNVHQAWELTRNESLGRRLYPLLAAATNQYVHWLNRSADGLYHLPPTFSPEYLAGPGDGDTSYDLAICRWGLRATLELASELGIDRDPRTTVFRDRLANLANFSTDSRGLSVARGLPFSQPHRHFSHLLGIVLRDPTIMGDTQLLERSVDNWRSLRVRDAHSQVNQTPAVSRRLVSAGSVHDEQPPQDQGRWLGRLLLRRVRAPQLAAAAPFARHRRRLAHGRTEQSNLVHSFLPSRC